MDSFLTLNFIKLKEWSDWGYFCRNVCRSNARGYMRDKQRIRRVTLPFRLIYERL